MKPSLVVLWWSKHKTRWKPAAYSLHTWVTSLMSINQRIYSKFLSVEDHVITGAEQPQTARPVSYRNKTFGLILHWKRKDDQTWLPSGVLWQLRKWPQCPGACPQRRRRCDSATEPWPEVFPPFSCAGLNPAAQPNSASQIETFHRFTSALHRNTTSEWGVGCSCRVFSQEEDNYKCVLKASQDPHETEQEVQRWGNAGVTLPQAGAITVYLVEAFVSNERKDGGITKLEPTWS